ncbi:MAG: hypothetical protein QNK23_06825 [Crocinitomicaceae bacterium]|nr:hypothetical protein [Crocinitomicaceae bacterium]
MKSIYFCAFFALFSCTSPTNNAEDESTEEVVTDNITEVESTAEIIPQGFPLELIGLESDFTQLKLPFSLVTGSMDSIERTELTFEQFNFLTQNFRLQQEDDDYSVDLCKKMYSLKEKNEYDDYSDDLHIGQLGDAVANAYGIVDLDSALMVFWTISYSSYQACPYYTGEELFVSVIQNDSVQVTMQIADEYKGGDPPFSWSLYSELLITKELEVKRKDVETEFDEDILVESDTAHINYHLNWSGN